MSCTARPGEDGTLAGHAGDSRQSPYSHSGVMASAGGDAEGHRQSAPAGRRRAGPRKGLVASRLEVAKKHVLPAALCDQADRRGLKRRPFFIIVAEDHAHPPQELTRPDWAYGDRLIVEKFIPGKEVDLRGDGR